MLAAVATAASAEDTLGSLADSCTTLAAGTVLRVRQILFAARRLRCPVPADDGDHPPKFAALAGEYADVLADPPPAARPASGPQPAFELRIETGTQPMPPSWPI